MKITSFNPTIITKHYDEVVKVFEDLGFEKQHNPTGVSALGNEYQSCRMVDSNGFVVAVATTTGAAERDATNVHMNVDNFDEARELLLAHGFKSVTNDTATNTGSAKADVLVSSSGFCINLVEHLKK